MKNYDLYDLRVTIDANELTRVLMGVGPAQR